VINNPKVVSFDWLKSQKLHNVRKLLKDQLLRRFLEMKGNIYPCTVLAVGSDDVAASYYVGVLSRAHGWQKGRKSGGSCARQLLSWRALGSC